ncbi:MAG: cytochrome c-type biogenesis protein [Hyphomicrobiaceae bacterium]
MMIFFKQTLQAFVLALRVMLIALAGTACLPSVAQAVEPDEILSDPKLEARAREISLGLRCLVCQNQSIDDSDAPLARDLRLLVRERLQAGDNNEQVIDYIVARYGNFVLLKPPLNWHTSLLWLAPLMLLLGAIFLARRAMSQSVGPSDGSSAVELLSDEEKKRLEEILTEATADTTPPNIDKKS